MSKVKKTGKASPIKRIGFVDEHQILQYYFLSAKKNKSFAGNKHQKKKTATASANCNSHFLMNLA
jgi:hypothetical protein